MTPRAMVEGLEIAAAMFELAAESASVMGLRAVQAAKGGPNAISEAWLMYSEKVAATADLHANLLSGALGSTPVAATKGTLRYYRRKVTANRRRLTRRRG